MIVVGHSVMEDRGSPATGQVMSPLRLVLRLAALIFVAEALIMIFRALVLESGPFDLRSTIGSALVDGSLLVAISSVAIYHWVVKPYVAARDAAERALRESEERFRQVAENVSAIILQTKS